MNTGSRRVGYRWAWGGWTWVVLLVCLGCTPKDAEPSASQSGEAPYAASGGLRPDPATQDEADDAAALAELNAGSETGDVDMSGAPAAEGDVDPVADSVGAVLPGPAANAPAASESDPFARMLPPEAARDVTTPFTIQGAEPNNKPATATQAELRADLGPKELLEFLSVADADMQLIVSGRSGIEDPKEARRTLLRIVKMKLEASRRLTSHADSDDKARSEGARGELQSLSHLAALGDVKAAEELEELAESHLESDDPQLVADSRLVLIGFAIESLQNGDETAADRIILYVDQIAGSGTKPDVAAMMVMGEARQILKDKGFEEPARQIRARIIELFADSPEPQIAEMAARMAGNVRFDGIDQLLDRVTEGNEAVDVARWTEAVETLLDESADLQTVQYLGGAALELEAHGKTALADATYESLTKRFTDPSAATTQEATLALAAYQARQDVIGQVFLPDLAAVDGSPLSLNDYRGKVVLIPFWAMNFPQSLQVLPQLRATVDAHPNRVAIVGVNLDADGEPVAEFVAANRLAFPSFRATNEVTNQLAERFGIVSMPFTVILSEDGRVAEIDFTGKKLESAVKRLLAP